MGGTPALQNGGHEDTQRATEGERLDGEGGPQRCLLHNSDTHGPSTLPELYSRTKTLPVHMPTFRSIMCTMGIHESDEATGNLSSCYGGENDSLHRRHSSDGRHSSSGEEPPGSADILVDRSGVCYQCSKVCNHPNQQIEFMGLKVDSTSLWLSLPGEKLHHIRMEVSQHLQRSQVTARQVGQLIE